MPNNEPALNLISQYPDWEGAKVLHLLINHPDTDIYATVVELCLENTVPPLEAQNLRFHLTPIKMTDTTTLKQVKQRINKLIAQLATSPPPLQSSPLRSSPLRSSPLRSSPLRSSPIGEATSLSTEIHALTRYIKETTLPTGTIKCFNDDDTKAYRRQASAIRRLLNQAVKDGHHEAVAIIRHNLHKGKMFRWES